MKPHLWLAVAVVACSPLAHAGEPWWLPKWCERWTQHPCGCPDDYCGKPMPCVRPVPNGCVDDYCRKPLPPYIVPTVCACPDNYCPKACPLLIGRPCGPWYKCCPTDKLITASPELATSSLR
ncbi:MAG: hypothetical protein U0746_06335 [Gemmataceae bacterium]